VLIEKAANVATAGGSGTAVVFGLTPSEWSVVGVIGGLIVAIAGLLVNIHFKQKHLQLARERAGVGEDE
jgi:hypothetical protein